ncbi:PAS domain-containing sensor histidine kinase [Salidesulfovibrio onnuriiensis]|uniref:PAS domain-containing sensor histidine kinase n=1 Tax=Salidesulfovibrio onnuriiensis TaxID=2583823 RepID=UPI0011CA5385|nr:ATP-binding protein [Salidesulfovibrio onnuriiensis]
MNLQDYYDTVMRLSHGIVVTLDLDGSIIHGNTLLETLTGYSLRELAGEDWFETFIDEERREDARSQVLSMAGEQGVSSLSGSIRARGGNKVYIDWNLKALTDTSDEVVSILCVGKDVTEHMLRQKGLLRERFTLMERNKELKCLFDISMLISDSRQELDDILRRIVNLLPSGFQRPGRTHVSLIVDNDAWQTPDYEPSEFCLEEPIVIGDKRRGTLKIAVTGRKRGFRKKVFLEDEHNLLATAAQQVAVIVSKRETRLAKEKLEQQLRQADRLAKIGQFSAGVAHEINEPLANILGFAQLALQTKGLPEQVTADLGNIVDSSLHAREVIRKLMFFSRQLPPQFVPTDLNEIIEQALRITEANAKRYGIEVVRDFDLSLPEVNADPQHIKQVVVNLVANAIQAMEQGGTLTIRTVNHKDDAYILVEDTGPGIPPEQLKQIFTPFFSTKDVDKGTGLGLSVVHGIVDAHGGFIQVHSDPGQGTRVEVAFPCQKNSENIEE